MPVGRRRKSMAPRKPCGRLKQQPKAKEAENVWPTQEVMARRVALLGSSSEVGELECPITLLGRQLDADQAHAARKAKATYARFSMAVQTPRIVTGSLSDFVQGSGVAPSLPTDMLEERKAELEEMRRAVLREVKWQFRESQTRAGPASRQAWREVHSLMLGRMPRNIHALRYGLNAIIKHYDLNRSQEVVVVRDTAVKAA